MAPRTSKAASTPPAILTADEVAQFLRVTKKTVYTLAKQGDLRSFRVGRAVRFHRSDVDAFIDAGRAEQEAST